MNGVQAVLNAVEEVREGIRAGAGPLEVIEAIAPLLIEFSMSPEVLNPVAETALQHRVHLALRNAGLLVMADLTGDVE